jgi:hypothetical protein
MGIRETYKLMGIAIQIKLGPSSSFLPLKNGEDLAQLQKK